MAIHLFNTHQWYLAHDAFEQIWHESDVEFRPFLQGIIQVSVAEYHLENGNLRGSILLMAEGLGHLKSFSSSASDVDLDPFIDIISQRFLALQTQSSLLDLPLPSLNLVRHPHG